MKLVDKYDPILKQKCEPFPFDRGGAVELFEELKATMIQHRGVGLAAPQIGIPYQVFVVGNPGDPDNIFGVFNPKMLSTFGEDVVYEEGCLTYPGVYCKIKRPSGIRVRYTNPEGITDTIKFDGMTARIVQHEYDHLMGTVFKDLVSKFVWDRAEGKAKKINKMRERI